MSEKVLQNSVSELTRSIDWDYLEAQSIVSFQGGLKEVQKDNPDESKKDLSLYSLVLKSKSLNSPIYRHNEMSTKYNMISSVPMKLYKMQKSIDLFV